MNVDDINNDLIKGTKVIFNSFVKKMAEDGKALVQSKIPYLTENNLRTDYQVAYVYLSLLANTKMGRTLFYATYKIKIGPDIVPVRVRFILSDKSKKSSTTNGYFIKSQKGQEMGVYYEKKSTWPSVVIYVYPPRVIRISFTQSMMNYMLKMKYTILHEVGHAYDYWRDTFKDIEDSDNIPGRSTDLLSYIMYFLHPSELSSFLKECYALYRDEIKRLKSKANRRKNSLFIRKLVDTSRVNDYQNGPSFPTIVGQMLVSRLEKRNFLQLSPKDNLSLISLYRQLVVNDTSADTMFIFLYTMLVILPRSPYKHLLDTRDYRNFTQAQDALSRQHDNMPIKSKLKAVYRYLSVTAHRLQTCTKKNSAYYKCLSMVSDENINNIISDPIQAANLLTLCNKLQ